MANTIFIVNQLAVGTATATVSGDGNGNGCGSTGRPPGVDILVDGDRAADMKVIVGRLAEVFASDFLQG